jgi:COMPASS component SWD2
MSSLALDAEAMKRFAVGRVHTPGPVGSGQDGSQEGRITSLDFDATGNYLAACSSDDMVRLYGVKTGQCLKAVRVSRLGAGLVRCTHHPQALLVASTDTASEDRVQYLSLHDNSYLRLFQGHTAPVVSMEVSPVDDTFLTASLDRTARKWDLRTPQCIGLIQASHRPAVAFGPQGLIFAVGGHGTVKLYDARSCEQGPFADFTCAKQQGAGGAMVGAWDSMSFSRDGQTLLLAAADQRVLLLDAFSGKVRREYRAAAPDPAGLEAGPAAGASEACLSPDAQFVLAGSRDGDVSVWDTQSGQLVTSLRGHPQGTSVRCVRWNPSRLMLASGSHSLALWIPDIGSTPRAAKKSSLSSAAAASPSALAPPIPASTAALTVKL